MAERGQAGDGQGEAAESGQRVEPDEDEGSDAGGQEAGHQHQAQHRAAEAGRLHQEERPDDGGAEQGADGGEAPGRGDHCRRHGRGVLLGQVHGQCAQPAADGDQRSLGTEDHTKAEGGQRGQDDAGKLGGGGCATGLEPLGRLVAGGTRKVLDGGPDQDAGDGQQRQRPPRRGPAKPSSLGRELKNQFWRTATSFKKK